MNKEKILLNGRYKWLIRSGSRRIKIISRDKRTGIPCTFIDDKGRVHMYSFHMNEWGFMPGIGEIYHNTNVEEHELRKTEGQIILCKIERDIMTEETKKEEETKCDETKEPSQLQEALAVIDLYGDQLKKEEEEFERACKNRNHWVDVANEQSLKITSIRDLIFHTTRFFIKNGLIIEDKECVEHDWKDVDPNGNTILFKCSLCDKVNKAED